MAAGLAALCAPALGQSLLLDPEDSRQLRGEVSEQAVNSALSGEQAGAPAYEPGSDGGASSQPGAPDGSPSDDQTDAQDSVFGDAPVSTTMPKTAIARNEEARERLLAAPGAPAAAETATERRRRQQLEPVDAATTGTIPAGTVDSQAGQTNAVRAGRVQPIEGLPSRYEENPYEAVGIEAGSFILRPSVETGVTITDNLNSSPDGNDAVLSETTLRLNALSEIGGDRTLFDGRGIFRKSVSGDDYDYKEGGFDSEIERALAGGYTAKAALSYAIRPESYSSPVDLGDVLDQPIQQTLTASAGVSKDVGKLRLGVTADIDREWYGDAKTEAGSVSQEDRNSTLATVSLRGGYEISPAITPFVEVTAGRRLYDITQALPGNGIDPPPRPLDRSANHLAANAGVELDLGEKLSGEIAAGYVTEDIDDARLKSIGGFNVEGSLNWSPVRGTVVGLTGSTTVEGATEVNSSGSLLYSGGLSVERQLRSNLTGNVALGAAYRDYQSTGDNDVILSAEAGATWWLNRYVGLVSRGRHETVKSTLPNRDTQTNSVFLGLRLQR